MGDAMIGCRHHGRTGPRVLEGLRSSVLGLVLGWGGLAPSHAADLTLDCSTAAGYQPCSASLDSARFSPDGIALSTWPGGSNVLVLPSAAGSRTVTVEGTKALGGIKVKGARYVVSGSGSLNLAMAPTVFQLDSAVTVSAILSGSVDLEKRGPGTLTLSGSNTWTGQLRVFQDTLRLGSDSALGNVEALTSAETGGVLDLAGRAVGTEMMQLNGGALVNQDTARKTQVQRLVVTVDSRIGGNGGIQLRKLAHPSPFLSVKAGATLTKTDTGEVELHGLPLDLGGTLRASRGVVSFHYGTRYQGTGILQVDSGAMMVFRNDSPGVVLPYEVRMNGADIGVWNGLATTVFANDLVVSGNHRNVLNNTSNLRISGRITGTGRVLSKWSEGGVVLRGENPWRGTLSVDGGEVRVGDGTDTGSVACDTLQTNASLVFHHSGTKTFAGRIRGTGTLAREGTGTTVLTGSVTPAKGTSVRSGTLQIGSGGAAGSIAGTLDVAGTLVVDRSGTLVLSDTLRGSGSLVKRGAGTLVLSGANSFRGPTRIDAGTVRIDTPADSSPVEVRSGSILEGRGRVGAVDLQGTLRPGSDSAIGVLTAGSLAIPEFSPATVRIRARGATKPGVEYDRLAAAGEVRLGTRARLELDLSGFSAAGTITGVVQGSSLAGTFDTLLLTGDSGWIATVRYTSRSVDVVVVRDSSGDSIPDTTVVPPPPRVSDTLDTLLAPGSDTSRLVVRRTATLSAPPRTAPRRVLSFLLDSTLGRGIRGADTALVVAQATGFAEPLLVGLPLSLVPTSRRLAGATPSVFRMDERGKVLLVPSTWGGDSIARFAVASAGAYWLGWDTVAPLATLSLDRDSLGPGLTARADASLRDNVASSILELCLLLPGVASPSCSVAGSGDSLDVVRNFTRSDLPLGATLFARAVDSRRVTESDSTDVVVLLDALPEAPTRLEDAYELLSLPYATAAGSAIATFRGLWGPPDTRRWRAWGWDAAGFGEVLDGDARSLAGQAWWIRSRGIPRTWNIAPTWTLPVSEPFRVTLRPGWNLVGNPYATPLDWSAARVASALDSLGVVGPYLRDGASGTWIFPDPSASISVGRGAAVFNPRSEPVVLRLPSRSATELAGRSTAVGGWSGVSLRWVQGTRASSWIRLGVVPDEEGAAGRIYPLPPAPERALSGWIVGRGTGPDLLGEIRVRRAGADEWTLHLEGVGTDAPLLLEMVREGPDTALALRLREGLSGAWTPMVPGMLLRDGAGMRSFAVAIGGVPRGPGAGAGLSVAVRSGRLEWVLPPEAGRVRVRIELRDLSGRLVSVPVDEVMDPGSYQRVLGVPRASRARVVVLRAGGAFRTGHFADLR